MSSKRRFAVTGPESSGTNYVARVLEAGGAEVFHRSQPNGLDWLDFQAMLDYPASGYDSPTPPLDGIVIVIRGRLAHISSMMRRNMELTWEAGDARRRAALGHLASLFGDPRVTVVTYESMASREERVNLLWSLELDTSNIDDESIAYHDQNGQYYS